MDRRRIDEIFELAWDDDEPPGMGVLRAHLAVLAELAFCPWPQAVGFVQVQRQRREKLDMQTMAWTNLAALTMTLTEVYPMRTLPALLDVQCKRMKISGARIRRLLELLQHPAPEPSRSWAALVASLASAASITQGDGWDPPQPRGRVAAGGTGKRRALLPPGLQA